MGRKKIKIQPIKGERNRMATYIKRKAGLFKKAHELAVLTDSDVAVLVFTRNGKLAEYCSCDVDQMLMRYSEHKGAVEQHRPEEFAESGSASEERGLTADAWVHQGARTSETSSDSKQDLSHDASAHISQALTPKLLTPLAPQPETERRRASMPDVSSATGRSTWEADMPSHGAAMPRGPSWAVSPATSAARRWNETGMADGAMPAPIVRRVSTSAVTSSQTPPMPPSLPPPRRFAQPMDTSKSPLGPFAPHMSAQPPVPAIALPHEEPLSTSTLSMHSSSEPCISPTLQSPLGTVIAMPTVDSSACAPPTTAAAAGAASPQVPIQLSPGTVPVAMRLPDSQLLVPGLPEPGLTSPLSHPSLPNSPLSGHAMLPHLELSPGSHPPAMAPATQPARMASPSPMTIPSQPQPSSTSLPTQLPPSSLSAQQNTDGLLSAAPVHVSPTHTMSMSKGTWPPP